MAFQPAPKPPSLLGYYRVLSPSAGVRVSPLCLGAMNFGDAWKGFMGECDKKTSFEVLDYFFDNGGNFIDTSNNYQAEESELWIGEWMKARQNRDELVLATKFTSVYPAKTPVNIKVNHAGNHSKSLRVSLAASLAKLQTSYIDLLYVHWWDFTTSVPELMRSLHAMVTAGKVLYLGISDTPAWIVAKANEYARNFGLTPFSVYQGHWSAAVRDFERDILPMVEMEGMALAPWGSLGRGSFKTEEDMAAKEEGKEGRQMGGQTEKQKAVSLALDKIAKAKETEITSIALSYVMHKAPYVFPIIGGRNIKHLKSNIEALALELSTGDIEAIEDATEFDVGFPMNMLFGYGGKTKWNSSLEYKDMALLQAASHLDQPTKIAPAKPHGN
ncbi:Norsolorinic acid reductase [Lachnellula suecica]|uniref:Norsolorinic acid reductase n=1 Tax=Lachnellula suecica TaxID=602035 RepID=A0A8T9C0M1_9HELO|nr:Norsolorinic acid reductase [Lachnellula suecica]